MTYIQRIRSEDLSVKYKEWLITEYVKLGWYFQGESENSEFPHSFLSFICEGEAKLPIPDVSLFRGRKSSH